MGGESDWLRGDELAMVIRVDHQEIDAAFTVVAATPAIGIAVGHAIADPDLASALEAVVAGKRADAMPPVTRGDRRLQPINQPVIEGGAVRFVVHRLIDVTELVVRQEQAESALDAFGFSVGHDLRFPLRVIDGYTRALDEDCAEQIDAQGRDYIKAIRGGVARMEAMIESLRELTRIGREPFERVTVDITALARELVGKHAGSRDVEIADGLTAHADRKLIATALGQLIDNAWKFTANTKAARIAIGSADGALFVRDNGSGFDARAERLFTPFRKLHATDVPGVGMGLAIAKRAITRHGGRMWAEAAPGQGATIYFVV